MTVLFPVGSATSPSERDFPLDSEGTQSDPIPERSPLRNRARPTDTQLAESPPETGGPEPLRRERVERSRRELTCEIVFWRGYRQARFYACVLEETGEPLAVAESPAFRSPGTSMPDRTEATVAAHDALTEALLSDGWELVRKGPGWYQAKFRR